MPFGTTREGIPVEKLVLNNGRLETEILTYGGILAALRVPDRSGVPVDVVLGYETVAGYENNSGYVGAIVGRYANRIGRSRITVDGTVYELTANEGENMLHGGPEGFNTQVFTVEDQGDDYAVLSYTESDGKNGFPGTLSLTVTYRLLNSGISLRYHAVSDRPTVCNITNHSYFNLNGAGTAMHHRLWLDAEAFTPVYPDKIPVRLADPVQGTPMDFSREKEVGRDIDADFAQLKDARGYDHNYVLNREDGLRLAARLTGDLTGIVMECWTQKPCLQLYTANYLATDATAKGGIPYRGRQAVCLETQFPPDSPNHSEWGDTILRPGSEYDYTTEFRFLT